jgi:hypothetical protein
MSHLDSVGADCSGSPPFEAQPHQGSRQPLAPGGCRAAPLRGGPCSSGTDDRPVPQGFNREDASFSASEAKADHADGPSPPQAIGVDREEPFCATENSAIVNLDQA